MVDTVTWVSLKEASARAGVSVSWLRKQYRQNGLPTQETIGPRGPQKAVPLEEVLARAAAFVAEPPHAKAAHSTASTDSPHAAATTVDVHALLERVAGFDRERALMERLLDAERRAAQAQAESAYLRLRLEDAFAELEDVRTQLPRRRS